jgi:hypothetical protein
MKNFPHLTGIKIGSQVVFGRTNGEQTNGEVIKINRKSVKVRQTEVRHGNGRTPRQEGAIWNVHPSLLKLENSMKTVLPTNLVRTLTPCCYFTKGDRVTFESKEGDKVVGIVKRVNLKTISVRPLGSEYSLYWRLSPELLTLAT